MGFFCWGGRVISVCFSLFVMVRQRSVQRRRSVRKARRGLRDGSARRSGTRSGSGRRKLAGSDLSNYSNEFECSTSSDKSVKPEIVPQNSEPPGINPYAQTYKPRGCTRGLLSKFRDNQGTEWRKPRAVILMKLYKQYRTDPEQLQLPTNYDKQNFINWQYQNIATICSQQGISDLQIPTKVSEDTLFNWQVPSQEFYLPTISNSGTPPTKTKVIEPEVRVNIPPVYSNEQTDQPVMALTNERDDYFGNNSNHSRNASSSSLSDVSVSSYESGSSTLSFPSSRDSVASESSASSVSSQESL